MIVLEYFIYTEAAEEPEENREAIL